MNPVFFAQNLIFFGRLIAAGFGGFFGILALLAMLRGKKENAATWGVLLGFFAGVFFVLGGANLVMGGQAFESQLMGLLNAFTSGRLEDTFPLPTLPPIPTTPGAFVPGPHFAMLIVALPFRWHRAIDFLFRR